MVISLVSPQIKRNIVGRRIKRSNCLGPARGAASLQHEYSAFSLQKGAVDTKQAQKCQLRSRVLSQHLDSRSRRVNEGLVILPLFELLGLLFIAPFDEVE